MTTYKQLTQQLITITTLLKELRYVLRANSHIISPVYSETLELTEDYICGLQYWVRFFEGYVNSKDNIDQYLEDCALHIKSKNITNKKKILLPNVEESLHFFRKVIHYFENPTNLSAVRNNLAEIKASVAQSKLSILDFKRSSHLGNTPRLFDKKEHEYSRQVSIAVEIIKRLDQALKSGKENKIVSSVNDLLLEIKYLINTYTNSLNVFTTIADKKLQIDIIELLFKIHFLLTENYTRFVQSGVEQSSLDKCLERMVRFAINNDIITFNDFLLDLHPGLAPEKHPLANLSVTAEKVTTLNAELTAIWPMLSTGFCSLLAQAEDLFKASTCTSLAKKSSMSRTSTTTATSRTFSTSSASHKRPRLGM